MDSISPERRSENMRRIRSKNSRPEVKLRKLIYEIGYRYRLHGKDLPGRPDLVFSKRRKTIFLHGCFWHQHPGCRNSHVPNSRQEYWIPKLAKNKSRDEQNLRKLEELGWGVLVVWECELKNSDTLVQRLKRFLGPTVWPA